MVGPGEGEWRVALESYVWLCVSELLRTRHRASPSHQNLHLKALRLLSYQISELIWIIRAEGCGVQRRITQVSSDGGSVFVLHIHNFIHLRAAKTLCVESWKIKLPPTTKKAGFIKKSKVERSILLITTPLHPLLFANPGKVVGQVEHFHRSLPVLDCVGLLVLEDFSSRASSSLGLSTLVVPADGLSSCE